jgi:hypothetical protein
MELTEIRFMCMSGHMLTFGMIFLGNVRKPSPVVRRDCPLSAVFTEFEE